MRYRFGAFELDEEKRELRRAGQVRAIQPRTFDLLRHLIRHRHRVVDVRELLENVWADAVVSPPALRRAVKEARRAVGDDGRRQQVLRTVHARGYRFVAPVAHIEDGDAEAEDDATPPGRAAERLPFVGRRALLKRLDATVAEAFGGRTRVVLVSGEIGVGKTRMVEELAERARARGAAFHVAWGYEVEGSPACWPWAQVLRELAVERGALGIGAADPLVRDLADWLPDVVSGEAFSTASAAPAGEGFGLFAAASRLLGAAARARPRVILLDDLHSADVASLELMGFVSRELARSPLLLVGAYRESELAACPALAAARSRLLRSRRCEEVTLSGLTREEVAELVALHTDGAVGNALAAVLHRMTEGNPLTIQESLRWLAAEHDLAAPRSVEAWSQIVPRSAERAIERRFERLAPHVRTTLRAAAVLGPAFEAEWLARLEERPLQELVDTLAEAVARGAIRRAPTAPDRYEFAHALVRDRFYSELGRPARARLHARLVRILEPYVRGPRDPQWEELAHHAWAGVPEVPASDARRMAWAAARCAEAQGAFDRAVPHYERIVALESHARRPEHECELRLALAGGRDRAGSREEARQEYRAVLERARRCRAATLEARAALGLAGRRVGYRPPTPSCSTHSAVRWSDWARGTPGSVRACWRASPPSTSARPSPAAGSHWPARP